MLMMTALRCPATNLRSVRHPSSERPLAALSCSFHQSLFSVCIATTRTTLSDLLRTTTAQESEKNSTDSSVAAQSAAYQLISGEEHILCTGGNFGA